MDLFEAQIQVEVEKRLDHEIQKQLTDPGALQKHLLRLAETNKQLALKNSELEIEIRKYFDADGYADAGELSAYLQLEYITPSGKVDRVGRNYFLQMLVHDGFIMKVHGSDGGYRHKKQYEGKIGVTRVVIDRNDRKRSKVYYTMEGFEKLKNHFTKDDRVWRSGKSKYGENIIWAE